MQITSSITTINDIPCTPLPRPRRHDVEFQGIDEEVLVLALQYLEKQGKASLFSVDDSSGVKFV